MRDRMGNAILVKETRTLFGFGVVRDWPDREILERFCTADRAESEAAFGVLVQRHGPMVLQVCRQVLVDTHDAQDAFQATFLVFLRRAGSIRKRDSLASWLFGVALRVARRARYAAILRRFHEKQAGELAAASSPTASGETATVAALHEEIARLPERFRETVLICHLEGLSTAAAAQRLGCSQGTILSRLSRARERLRRRMTGRGLAVPAGILVASGVPQASAGALPAPLLSATVAAAWPALAGRAGLAESVTPSVELLTRISLRGLLMTRIKLAVSLTAAAAVVTALAIPIARSGLAAVATTASPVLQSQQRAERSRPIEKDRSAQIPNQGSPRSDSLSTLRLAAPGRRVVMLKTDQAMALAYAPDGRMLATAGCGETIDLWDLLTGARLGSLAAEKSIIRSVAFGPGGKLLASAGDEGIVRLWDVATGAQEREFPGVSGSFREVDRDGGVTAVAIDSEGSLLATAAGAGVNPVVPEAIHEVTVYDPRTGRRRWSHFGRGESALALAFSPGGDILASAGGPAIHLWNARTGEPVRKLASKGGIFSVAFTPDGRTVAGGGLAGGGGGRPPDGFITLWNVASGEVLHTLDWNTGLVRAVAVSPDGKTVAGGGDGHMKDLGNTKKRVGEVSLWEIATSRLLWTFEGGPGDLNALAFAPDGKTLAYSDQEAVGVIDARTGKRGRTLRTTKQTPQP